MTDWTCSNCGCNRFVGRQNVKERVNPKTGMREMMADGPEEFHCKRCGAPKEEEKKEKSPKGFIDAKSEEVVKSDKK
jgi:hypothetical protein